MRCGAETRYLRPQLDGVEWLDSAIDDSAAEIAIVAGDPLVGEWKRATDAAARLLGEGFDQVVLLWVGATAVLSALDALVGAQPGPMTLRGESRSASAPTTALCRPRPISPMSASSAPALPCSGRHRCRRWSGWQPTSSGASSVGRLLAVLRSCSALTCAPMNDRCREVALGLRGPGAARRCRLRLAQPVDARSRRRWARCASSCWAIRSGNGRWRQPELNSPATGRSCACRAA